MLIIKIKLKSVLCLWLVLDEMTDVLMYVFILSHFTLEYNENIIPHWNYIRSFIILVIYGDKRSVKLKENILWESIAVWNS